MIYSRIDYEGKIKRNDFNQITPGKPFMMMDLSKLSLNRYNMYYDNTDLRKLEKVLKVNLKYDRKKSARKRSKSPKRRSIMKSLDKSEFAESIRELSDHSRFMIKQVNKKTTPHITIS